MYYALGLLSCTYYISHIVKDFAHVLSQHHYLCINPMDVQ